MGDQVCAERSSGITGLAYIARTLAMLATTLFLRSWEQGEKTFVSMNSRCYDGKLVFFEEKRPISINDIMLTCLYVVVITSVWYTTRNVIII